MEPNKEQIVTEIVERATKGQFTEFHFIRSFNEFLYWREEVRITKLNIKSLTEVADKLFKNYCKEIVTGTADVTNLLAYTEITDIVAFYKTELSTFERMLDEYRGYLSHGNFIRALLGEERDI